MQFSSYLLGYSALTSELSPLVLRDHFDVHHSVLHQVPGPEQTGEGVLEEHVSVDLSNCKRKKSQQMQKRWQFFVGLH